MKSINRKSFDSLLNDKIWVIWGIASLIFYVLAAISILFLAVDIITTREFIDRNMRNIALDMLLGFLFFVAYTSFKPTKTNLMPKVYGITLAVAITLMVISRIF